MTNSPNKMLPKIAGRIPPSSEKREGVSVKKPGDISLVNPSLKTSKTNKARITNPMDKPIKNSISKILPIFSLFSTCELNSSSFP
jgi:hypothetical protein